MAAKTTKKAAFRDHLAALQELTSGKRLPGGSSFLLVYGTSEYLLGETVRLLRERAVAGGAVVTSLEAGTLNEASLQALCSQASLFEKTTFYVIRRVESAKSLPKLLKLLSASATTENHLCFVHTGETPPAPLRTELSRLKARVVPCFAPWPNELPQVLTQMADALGVKLRPDAVQLLIEAHGDDLVKQNNELRKLSLVLEMKAPLTAAEIAPHLGMLREDDAYQLDRLLLQRQWAKAHALAGGLIGRGEKGLALLAILSGHCRSALRITEALRRGVSQQDLASAVRLPPFIVKTYAQYLGRQTDPKRYIRALTLAQETDLLLKSRPVSEELLIARVIEELAAP